MTVLWIALAVAFALLMLTLEENQKRGQNDSHDKPELGESTLLGQGRPLPKRKIASPSNRNGTNVRPRVRHMPSRKVLPRSV